MGLDYNSLAEGKIPWERRNEKYPHSEEAASEDIESGLDQYGNCRTHGHIISGPET